MSWRTKWLKTTAMFGVGELISRQNIILPADIVKSSLMYFRRIPVVEVLLAVSGFPRCQRCRSRLKA